MSLQENLLVLEARSRDLAKRLTRLREDTSRAKEENRLLMERLAKAEARPSAPSSSMEDASPFFEALTERIDNAVRNIDRALQNSGDF